MKTNTTKKILFIIIFLLGVQVIYAQSYQRWVYWIEEEGHQLSAKEMGEITEMLYEGEIAPSKAFRLSTGVLLKIPQPYLYLDFIKVAVQSVRPWATKKDQILAAIKSSDRFKWGNDVSVKVKNHWVSDQNKKATFTNGYTGEGKNSFFLFIDGIPTFKCDCGNPLELMPEFYSYRHENDSRKNIQAEAEADRTKKATTSSENKEKELDPGFPKDLGALKQDFVKNIHKESNRKLFPEEESTWIDRNGSWFWPVTAGLITFGTGFVAHDKQHQWYIWFPKDQPPPVSAFVPVDTNGGSVGVGP